jgi:hypothetical protein
MEVGSPSSQGLNSKKETQLGKFELSPVKKEGLNSKSLKIFEARVKLSPDI